MVLDFTNIAHQNIPISTAALAHHVFPTHLHPFQKTFFKKFFEPFTGARGAHAHHFRIALPLLHTLKKRFSKKIFEIFFGPFPGLTPPFSNSPCSATYPLIFSDVSTSFLSPFYSVTSDVSKYSHHANHFRIPLPMIHTFSKKNFQKFFQKLFFKIFWAPSRGPRGSRPPFSNSLPLLHTLLKNFFKNFFQNFLGPFSGAHAHHFRISLVLLHTL